jgi:hypothetical protein
MELSTFTVIINTLKKQNDDVLELHRLNVNLMEFADPYESIIGTLLTEIYSLEGYDWFSWFCYENDFGNKVSKKNPKAWDKDEKPICYDVKSLWNYLETEYKTK